MLESIDRRIVGDMKWGYQTVFSLKVNPDKTGYAFAAKFPGTCPLLGYRYPAGTQVKWCRNTFDGADLILPVATSKALCLRFYQNRNEETGEVLEFDSCYITAYRLGDMATVQMERAMWPATKIELLFADLTTRTVKMDDKKSIMNAEKACKMKKAGMVGYIYHYQ